MVPRAERTMENEGVVLNIWKAESWIFNSGKAGINEYVREFLKGKHIATYDPKISIVYSKSSRIGWQEWEDGKDTYLHLRFRLDGHEPDGQNSIWYTYTWYDDDEICEQGVNCLEDAKIYGQKGPFNYYTTLFFSDDIDRTLIIYSYWFLFAQSFFYLIGLPFAVVIVSVVNLYIDYMVIYHLVLVFFAIFGWYEKEQNDTYSLWNWFVETVLFWSAGTRFVTFMTIFNSFIPVWGPIANGLIVWGMYYTIFN